MSANMDTDQLIEWLKKKGVKQSILDKLKDEEYNGTSFCMATEERLAQLGTPRLKQGPLTILVGLRDELKVVPPPSLPEPQPKPVAPEPNRPQSTPNQSGKSSMCYKAVQENLTSISDSIGQAPSALSALTLKFVKKRWIRGGDHLTPDQICTMALGRIAQDAKEFWDFVDILKDTEGTDIIGHTLESSVPRGPVTAVPKGADRVTADDSATGSSHPIMNFRQFGKPNLSQLINLVGVTVKNEWRAIGVGLGVMVADLDSFQEEEAGKIDATQHCMQRVFQKWHAAVTSEYSWVNLVQVLESPAVNRKAAVQELYESLCAQNK